MLLVQDTHIAMLKTAEKVHCIYNMPGIVLSTLYTMVLIMSPHITGKEIEVQNDRVT